MPRILHTFSNELLFAVLPSIVLTLSVRGAVLRLLRRVFASSADKVSEVPYLCFIFQSS